MLYGFIGLLLIGVIGALLIWRKTKQKKYVIIFSVFIFLMLMLQLLPIILIFLLDDGFPD